MSFNLFSRFYLSGDIVEIDGAKGTITKCPTE